MGDEKIEKKKLVNLLTKEEIAELDKLYNKKHSSATQRAMYIYSHDSNILNDCFRNYDGIWNKKLEEKYNISPIIFKNIFNSLEKGITFLKNDTRLYRGIEYYNTDIYPVNEEFNDKGYSSTSFDENVARHYAGKDGYVLIINAPKYSSGFYIRQHSRRPREIEFLLPRKCLLKVYKKDIGKKEIFCSIVKSDILKSLEK